MRKTNFLNLFEDITSHYFKIKKEDYLTEGLYPIIDQGQSFIGGYTNSTNLVNIENLPVIVFGDHTKVFKYIDFPFAIGADGVKVISLKDRTNNTKCYYYYLKSLILTNAGYSRHYKFLKDSHIPVINNKIYQNRISNILSTTEELINKRKYTIELLNIFLESTFFEMFGSVLTNLKAWQIVELKYFGEIITGNTPSRRVPEFYSDIFIEWIKTDNIVNEDTYISKAKEYLSEQGAANARTVEKGALLVCCIAGSIESVGRAALTDRKVSFNQQINAIQPNDDVSPLFLYWLIKTSKDYIQNQASKGMKKILSKGEFENIKFIKPPFNLQNEFANIAIKVEDVKKELKLCLIELENLFQSLNKSAFKEEIEFSDLPQNEISDSSEAVEILDAKLPNIDYLDKTSTLEVIEPEKDERKNKVTISNRKTTYAKLSPLIVDVKSTVADKRDLEQFIIEHFKDDYFAFEDLKKVYIKSNLTYDFEILKNLIFELLRERRLKQVFVDAAFKSTFKASDVYFKRVSELREQMYLQQAVTA